jgi:hypothetical protein
MSLLVAAGVAIAHRAGLRSAIGMRADGTPHCSEMTRAGWRSRDVTTRFARSMSSATPTMKLVHRHRAAMPQSVEHSNRRHAQTLAPSRAEPAIERSAVLLGLMSRPRSRHRAVH